MNCITTDNLNISYGSLDIVKNLNLKIPKGKITTIIGANGCGKSTVLKTIARILTPKSGEIYINEKNIKEQGAKELAKVMAVLPQSPQAPNGLTVEELIAYGRFPHQKGFGKLKKEDKNIIQWALEVTGLIEFRERDIEDLSGGQRQRAWIAMALAQQPKLLVLDEPTTYLDINHQLEIMELLKRLNDEQGLTVLMVLHELTQAVQYSHYMAIIKDGHLVTAGDTKEIVSDELFRDVFSVDVQIDTFDDKQYVRVKGLVE